jgi:hypothetical protein
MAAGVLVNLRVGHAADTERGTTMTLLKNLMLIESALTMLALLVSMRVMKSTASLALEAAPTSGANNPLGIARGLVAGGMLAAVLWNGMGILGALAAR